MRYRLRTLLIALAVVPPFTAVASWGFEQREWFAEGCSEVALRVRAAGELWDILNKPPRCHFGDENK